MLKERDIQKIKRIAEKHNLKKVDLFGSRARGNNKRRSDFDLLIDFNNQRMTLIDVVLIKREFEKSLGKRVDIIEYGMEGESFAIIDKVVPIYG